MRKSFATSIEEKIQTDFKEKCKQNNISMNDVLERLMLAYINEDVKIIPSFDVKFIKN